MSKKRKAGAGLAAASGYTSSPKRNLILIGTAEIISPPVRAEIQRVIENEGFYIATDVNQPGAEIPLASMGGKIYSMKVDNELAPDRFFDTVRFQGPHRADV